MPNNTDTAIALFSAFHFSGPVAARDFLCTVLRGCPDCLINCGFDRKELVIAGNQFVDCTAIRIVFEGDEVADQIEEASLLEHAANQRLQFERRSWSIELTFNCAPDFEPFLVSGKRANACFESIGYNRHFVVVHQRRNLLLVGLNLIVSGGEPFVAVFRNLQLDDSERQPVNEYDDVWPAVVLAFNNCELVHSQPVVCVGTVEVDQPNVIARDAAVIAAILDRNTVPQHAMKRAVVADE